MPAIPPTTPPTIAPVSADVDFSWEVGEEVAGGKAEEDVD